MISAQELVIEQRASRSITASTLYLQLQADISASTTETEYTTTDSYSLGLSGAQIIFDGLKTLNKIKATKEDIKAAQQNYRFVLSEARLNLRTAFIGLLKAQELIKVAEEIIKIRRNSLILITLRYESGLEHKGALLAAEANLAEAEFELNQAKRNLELAQRRLCKEIGYDEFKPILVKEDFTIDKIEIEEPHWEALVKNHPTLLKATANKSSQAFKIKSAYAEFLPEVSVSSG
ncbi:MAG: TolC family protein, partial [Candidatus Omnitrophica bacterium]|nr:TolC family protein [Candidatus Omnitrophota bacterium]